MADSRTSKLGGGSVTLNAGQIAYSDGVTLVGDNNFKWDSTLQRFSIGPTPAFNPTANEVVCRRDTSTTGTVIMANYALELYQGATTDGQYNGAQIFVSNDNVANGVAFTGPAINGLTGGVSWSKTGVVANNGANGVLGTVLVSHGTIGGNTIGAAGSVNVSGDCLVNMAAGMASRIVLSGGPLLTDAASMWVRPYFVSGFFGAIGNRAYGLLVDAPGLTGSNIFTMGVGLGNSFINGALAIGKNTAPNAQVEIVQASANGGSPTAVIITGGSHTNLDASLEINDLILNFNQTKTFNAGDIGLLRSIVKTFPVYAFDGASSVDYAVGEFVGNIPKAGINASFQNAYCTAFQPGNGNALNLGTHYCESPGIDDGVGNITSIVAHVYDLSPYMGDQTATIDNIYGINLIGRQLIGGANLRTINGDTAIIHVASPFSNGAHVTCLGDHYSILSSSGPNKFVGEMITAGETKKRTAVGQGSYSVLTSDYLIAKTDITVGGDTITLPNPSSVRVGKTYLLKDESGLASIRNITVVSAAGNVDGAASFIVASDYAAYGFYTDGTNWFVI